MCCVIELLTPSVQWILSRGNISGVLRGRGPGVPSVRGTGQPPTCSEHICAHLSGPRRRSSRPASRLD
jgi:hypothetical protein